MTDHTSDILSRSEIKELYALESRLIPMLEAQFTKEEAGRLRASLKQGLRMDIRAHSSHGIPHALLTLQTALAFSEMVDPDRNILVAILHYPLYKYGALPLDDIRAQWGDDTAALLDGVTTVSRFAAKNSAHNQDNFRGLILSLAKDIRIIIMMIVQNLVVMRRINQHPDQDWVKNVAFEANFLYAQLAHRLGLYKIKSELEDLSLKYSNREIYTQIAHKLNETKRDRDAYIKSFIDPFKKRLEDAGLKFDIKGRTKSISSIWAKMRKQKVDINGIYDLFAIRVIIDTPVEKEKSDCWLAYSILADMYRANPARMRDWISIPKSNGYESLHATVMGPGAKWVEVQFRTRRMDLVAEKGLAAHWRYKGVKGDSTDQWMNNIRDILESAGAGPMQLMRDLKIDDYGKEVYAFSPKGDLFRLPFGASVLDFAFHIHSNVGAHCTGAIINGAHRKINHKIQNGDTIDILTSPNQSPRSEWMGYVCSSKARNKIKQCLNEEKQRRANIGKELLDRRAKNRKIEIDEAALMKLIKKIGYKFVTEFYADLADDKVDVAKVLSQYLEATSTDTEQTRTSAEQFHIMPPSAPEEKGSSDVLMIGDNSISGLKYKFAKCCSPIYGDKVFGFVSSDGNIKIHKEDCPNAAHIREKYPYRLIRADWSGKSGDLLPVSLRVTGHDDIGIVTNITSIISKEPNASLRNISIDSFHGMFEGYLVIGISDLGRLNEVIRKIRTVKGVKNVVRM